MHNLHIINYNDFSAEELCNYLEERHYPQILADLETTQNYLEFLSSEEHSETTDLTNTLFHKLQEEVKQLFVKDHILLFPHVKKHPVSQISLAPINSIHQRVMAILQKLRGLMNNYVQQPNWSNQFKICCNELYAIEQNIQHILYIKENFLWTKIENRTAPAPE
ncbi:MAG: hypothetical protein IPM95_02715 [Sphingobacteriales bacterium]|nr:hypothetical protein [Sphingobacteriales bacterium]